MRHYLQCENVALVAAVALCTTTCTVPSQEFTSGEGRFSILLPVAPEEKTSTVSRPTRKLVLHAFYAALEPGGPVGYVRWRYASQPPFYYVSYFETGNLIETGEAFRQEREALADEIDGRVEDEREIALAGHPGIEFVVVAPTDSDFVMRVRMYTVGERFYTVWTAGTKKQVQSARAIAYLESFRPLE